MGFRIRIVLHVLALVLVVGATMVTVLSMGGADFAILLAVVACAIVASLAWTLWRWSLFRRHMKSHLTDGR